MGASPQVTGVEVGFWRGLVLKFSVSHDMIALFTTPWTDKRRSGDVNKIFKILLFLLGLSISLLVSMFEYGISTQCTSGRTCHDECVAQHGASICALSSSGEFTYPYSPDSDDYISCSKADGCLVQSDGTLDCGTSCLSRAEKYLVSGMISGFIVVPLKLAIFLVFKYLMGKWSACGGRMVKARRAFGAVLLIVMTVCFTIVGFAIAADLKQVLANFGVSVAITHFIGDPIKIILIYVVLRLVLKSPAAKLDPRYSSNPQQSQDAAKGLHELQISLSEQPPVSSTSSDGVEVSYSQNQPPTTWRGADALPATATPPSASDPGMQLAAVPLSTVYVKPAATSQGTVDVQADGSQQPVLDPPETRDETHQPHETELSNE